MYKNQEFENKPIQAKNSINTIIKSIFKDIYDLLSDDKKMFDTFPPQLIQFEQTVSEMDKRTELFRHNKSIISVAQEKPQ